MGLTTHVVRGERPERLLFLLHGLGSDERDLPQLMPYLDPEGRFVAVFPRGPYAMPPGYAWFKFGGPPTLVEGTLASSLDAAEEALDDACEHFGMRREEAVVGGFSQGAAVALVLALRSTPKPRPTAVLSMSGFIAAPQRFPIDREAEPKPAVLAQHGTDDPLIPLERGREVALTLSDAGVPVVWRTYQMEHQVSLDSVRDAKEWLDRVRAGERPSEPPPMEEPEAVEDDSLVKRVTSATFESEVLAANGPVIVDFWAPWCGPCRQVSPIVEQIAAMRQGSYKVVKVNIDEAPDLAQRYQIQSIPLVALFRNGRMERKSLGAKPRPQLEAELGMLVIP